MALDSPTPERPALVRPGALRALAGVAALIGLLVLAQAALAGRFLFISTGRLQDIHGFIGNIVVLLAIVQVVLVLTSGITGRLRTALLGQTAFLLILVLVQVALGYAGRDRDNNAAALHIPNGVLIFGLTMANISMATRALRDTGRAEE